MANLIDLRTRPAEERIEIARKGGLIKSEEKRIANLTKNLKHGRYASQFSLTVQELVKNPKTSALKIFDLIERIGEKWDELSPKMQMEICKLYMEAYRTCHGQRNLNVNVNTELKRDLEMWFENEETQQNKIL